MASNLEFMQFIAEQVQSAGLIRYRKMFGEYALYCNEKVVALVCDDQLFIKPTEAGKKFIENIVEAPPYPGANMYFLIENLEDRDWLSELVRVTAEELPERKMKKK